MSIIHNGKNYGTLVKLQGGGDVTIFRVYHNDEVENWRELNVATYNQAKQLYADGKEFLFEIYFDNHINVATSVYVDTDYMMFYFIAGDQFYDMWFWEAGDVYQSGTARPATSLPRKTVNSNNAYQIDNDQANDIIGNVNWWGYGDFRQWSLVYSTIEDDMSKSYRCACTSIATSGAYPAAIVEISFFDSDASKLIRYKLSRADWDDPEDQVVIDTRIINIGEGGGGSSDWNDITNKPDFKPVATSGSYNDLTDKPEIPTETTTWTFVFEDDTEMTKEIYIK